MLEELLHAHHGFEDESRAFQEYLLTTLVSAWFTIESLTDQVRRS
jgi:hypothetical protein